MPSADLLHEFDEGHTPDREFVDGMRNVPLPDDMDVGLDLVRRLSKERLAPLLAILHPILA